MVDTRSNMQLSDLNYKPQIGKSLRNIIDRAIGTRFYTPPESLHYQLLFLGQFCGTDHINCDKKKKTDIIKTSIPSARNPTTKACVDQI